MGPSVAQVGAQVTGVPVVKSETDNTLVGILSKKDLSKSGATVADIMSTPPVAARPTSTVADAAVLMLKHKVNTSFVASGWLQIDVFVCKVLRKPLRSLGRQERRRPSHPLN